MRQAVFPFIEWQNMTEARLASTPLIKSNTDITKKCIICQQAKKKNETVLTSTPDGIKKIISASDKLGDGKLNALSEDEKQKIHYHAKNCYSSYILKASRVSKGSSDDYQNDATNSSCNENENSDVPARSTRSSTGAGSSRDDEDICVVCGFAKHKQDTKLHRIAEHVSASKFLAAYEFNKDDVYRRCVFFKTVGDIFAADIMYHRNCMSGYILQFDRDMSRIKELYNAISPESTSLFEAAVDELCESLDLSSRGYALSECRDKINKKFESSGKNVTISNKHLKTLLIKKFSDKICFSYSYQKSESLMFFSSDIRTGEFVKKIRCTDSITECAKALRSECKAYDFELDSSYCDANDISISSKKYTLNRPLIWTKFFHELLEPRSPLSEQKQRVCDVIFQITHRLIHNNQKRTPLSIGYAEAILDLSRSKHLLQEASRLGICVSYEEIERIDTTIVKRITELAGPYRVPIPPHITDTNIIHGATDNFDQKDDKGGSHDSILMLFQNHKQGLQQNMTISERGEPTSTRSRKLESTLPCQNVIDVRRGHKRGSIPSNYVCSTESVPKSSNLLDHKVWSFVRMIAKDRHSQLFPSFSAINSLLSTENVIPTSVGFTPILPNPITEFESVYTVMVNFQDVLMQKGQKSGALWSDEGVYCIAKEIQLLHPEKFKNIFLGMGGFHTEKIILACCGKLLKDIGARDVYVQNEIYGPTVTDETILKGKDYVLCREAIRNLGEAVERIKIEKFKNGRDEQFAKLGELVQDLFDDPSLSNDSDIRLKSEEIFRRKWGAIKDYMEKNIHKEYCDFKKSGEENSEMWRFWNVFNDEVLPILIDMTRSFREGNWELYLQAIRKAIPLFFNCNRTHYSRWYPIFFEDCLNLKTTHPELYQSFCAGDFVVQHTNRRSSGMPMDQALEKEYNKKAKGPGGIIGITRQKESVAKWNLIKHEKKAYTNFIDEFCGLNQLDEYSLHHEFSSTFTKKDNHDVEVMKGYIETNCNLMKAGKLSNMVTRV